MEIYYTPEDIMEKYSMTRAAVATFALRYNVPRKTDIMKFIISNLL